jgi:hypothetical protein
VTPGGLDLIGERYREGLDFGDGLGDMHESTEQRMAVEFARRYIQAECAEDPDSAVVDVRLYHGGTAASGSTSPAWTPTARRSQPSRSSG